MFSPEGQAYSRQVNSSEREGKFRVLLNDDQNWLIGRLANGFVNFLVTKNREIIVTIDMHEVTKEEMKLADGQVVQEGSVGLKPDGDLGWGFKQGTETDPLNRAIQEGLKEALAPLVTKAAAQRKHLS